MTEFYPLQQGNRWGYTDIAIPGSAAASTVVKTTSRIFGTTAVGNNLSPETLNYYSNDAQGLRLHGTDIPFLGTFDFSPPILLAPANPSPGGADPQSGTVSGTALCGPALNIPTFISIGFSASHQVISLQSNHVIQGQSFPETLTTSLVVNVSGSVPAICGGFFSQQFVNETDTYARYIGPVRAVASGVTFELISTSVQALLANPFALTVNESAGAVSIPIRRIGSRFGGSSVQCFTDSAGTSALEGADYTAVNTLVEWTDIGVENCVVPILNDAIDELDETFNVLLSNQTASFGTITVPHSGPLGVSIIDDDFPSVQRNDFTGDAISDVLIRNSSNNQWFLYGMDGKNVVNASSGFAGIIDNVAWQTTGVADFTGDGKADVLVRNSGTNQWYLYSMDGRTVVGASSGFTALSNNVLWQP